MALVFGLVFMTIIKPLQTPDEAVHFIRAYQLSEGGVFQQQEKDTECWAGVGEPRVREEAIFSVMPRSIVSYADGDRDSYKVSEQLKVPLNSSDRVNVCARASAANSPIGYVPQTIAIGVVRVMNDSPVLLNYAARLGVLTVWVAFVYSAIRILPVRKWALGAIVLLPMAVQQSIAIGTDVLALAPLMVIVAMIIRSYYEKRNEYIKRDMAIMASLAAIAILSKPVMIVLLLLFPLYRIALPKNQSRRLVHVTKLIALVVPLAAWLLWSALASHYQVSVADIFAHGANQIDALKAEPVSGITAFITAGARYVLYDLSLWGFGSFGWFTSHLPQPISYAGFATLMLALVMGYTERINVLSRVTRRQVKTLNIALLITALGILVGNMFTLFIIFTQAGAWKIDGMQFRYLLPAFVMIAVMIELKYIRCTERFYRNFILINACALFLLSVAVITGLFSSVPYY